MSEQTDAALRAEIEGRQNEINILKEQLSTAKQTAKDIREKLKAAELRAQRDALLLKILNGEKLRDVQPRKSKADTVQTGEENLVYTDNEGARDEQEAVAA